MNDKNNSKELERLLNYSPKGSSSEEYDVIFEEGHYFIEKNYAEDKPSKINYHDIEKKINNLKGWDRLIFNKIESFNSKTFRLNQIYECIPEFQKKYPDNHMIKEKIRQRLQNLRDLGLIEFVASGEYKNLAYIYFGIKNRKKEIEISLKSKFLLHYKSIAPISHKNWYSGNLEKKLDQLSSKYHDSFYHDLFDIDLTKVDKEVRIIQLNVHQRRAAMNKSFDNYVRMTGGIANEIITYYIDFLKNRIYEKEFSTEEIYESTNHNRIEPKISGPTNISKNKEKDKDLDYYKFIIKNLKGWNKAVYDKISALDSEIFTSQDLQLFVPDFKELFPKNNDVNTSITTTIGKLRRLGLLERVSRGKYKNIMFFYSCSKVRKKSKFISSESYTDSNAESDINIKDIDIIEQNSNQEGISTKNILDEFLEYFTKIPIPPSYKFWISNDIKIKVEEIDIYYKWSYKKSLFDVKSSEDIRLIEKNIQNSNKDSSFGRFNIHINGIAKGIIQHYIEFLNNKVFKIDPNENEFINGDERIQFNGDSNLLVKNVEISEKTELDSNIFKEDNNKIAEIKDNLFSEEDKSCKICGKSILKTYSKNICKTCSRKSYGIKIINILLRHVDPEIEFKKEDLISIGYEDIQVQDYLWTLIELGLVVENDGKYYLEKNEILDKFIEENTYIDEENSTEPPAKSLKTGYDGDENKIKESNPVKLNKKCSICGKNLPILNFGMSDKHDDGLKEYCKGCSKKVNTVQYLNKLLSIVNYGKYFSYDDVKINYNEAMEFDHHIWSIQENDLIIEENGKYILKDEYNINEFLNKYSKFVDEHISFNNKTNSEKNNDSGNKNPKNISII